MLGKNFKWLVFNPLIGVEQLGGLENEWNNFVLLGQVSTCTGRNQLLIFFRTKCTWEDTTCSLFYVDVLDDAISHYEHTTVLWNQPQLAV